MSNIYKPTALGDAIRTVLVSSGTAALLLASSTSSAAVEVDVSGYVKADFIYDLDHDLGDTLAATGVPVGSTETDDGTFRAHAKQSRLRATFKDDASDVSGRIEVDLFDGSGNELVSNSRHFRLRHAFFNYANWTFGQTWSNYMDRDFIAYASTVDFGGPAGPAFVRQTQLRYTAGDFSVALENAESRILGEDTRDTTPDITARYAHSGDDFSWFAAGVLSNYEVSGGASDGESESNFGGQVGASIPFGSGDIFGVVASNGGRYTYYGWANPQAVVDGGSVETVDHTGASLGVNFNLGGPSNSKVTLVYGMIAFDDEHEAILGAAAPEELTTLHLNYRWSPAENINLGVEVSNASRENFSGDDGDATRLQFGAQYVF